MSLWEREGDKEAAWVLPSFTAPRSVPFPKIYHPSPPSSPPPSPSSPFLLKTLPFVFVPVTKRLLPETRLSLSHDRRGHRLRRGRQGGELVQKEIRKARSRTNTYSTLAKAVDEMKSSQKPETRQKVASLAKRRPEKVPAGKSVARANTNVIGYSCFPFGTDSTCTGLEGWLCPHK